MNGTCQSYGSPPRPLEPALRPAVRSTHRLQRRGAPGHFAPARPCARVVQGLACKASNAGSIPATASGPPPDGTVLAAARRGPSRPAAPAHGAVSQPSPFTNEPMPGVVTSSPSARRAATALRAVILATPHSPWIRDSLIRVFGGYVRA